MKSKNFLSFLFLAITSCHSLFSESVVNNFDKVEYELMDSVALTTETDKSSAYHNYTKIYSQYFKGCKNEPIKFLEIGIYKGDSVKFWEGYFSCAELHFIDITKKHILYHSDRSHYHFMDQSDIRSLRRFGSQQGSFDIILDDGGHTMNQQISSFIALFPTVKSAGLYIIEDLHTSYWKSYGGSGDVEKANNGTAVGYLKDLVDHVNFAGAASGCADSDKLSESVKMQMINLREQIESMHFHSSVCIIKKK